MTIEGSLTTLRRGWGWVGYFWGLNDGGDFMIHMDLASRFDGSGY